jgi:diacylglycerol kinase family enzyme
VTIDDVGLWRALPKLAKLYRGTLLGDPLVRHGASTRVRIEADPPAPVEADGQLVGTTPATFTIVPRALRVVHDLPGRC